MGTSIVLKIGDLRKVLPQLSTVVDIDILMMMCTINIIYCYSWDVLLWYFLATNKVSLLIIIIYYSNIASSSTFYSTQGGTMSPVLAALKAHCLRWSQQTLILVRSSDKLRLWFREPDHIVWAACRVLWPECNKKPRSNVHWLYLWATKIITVASQFL